jgi:hypothetical protein
MSQSDQEYLLARAEQERALASGSADEIARAMHLKLANEYAMRAHGGGTAAGADIELVGLALRELGTF